MSHDELILRTYKTSDDNRIEEIVKQAWLKATLWKRIEEQQVQDNAVDPVFGGKGIGSAMHRQVLRAMKHAGMEIAKIGVLTE